MSAQNQVQMQTATFLVKGRNIDYIEAATILEATGFRFCNWQFFGLAHPDWDSLASTLCQSKDGQCAGQDVYITYWYRGQPLCYGINKKHRLAPESYLSISVRKTADNQEPALVAIARMLDGTLLAVEDGPIAAPTADFDHELQQLIWQEIQF